MEPIRVYLGPMPAMLRAMINDLLSSEDDVVVTGRDRGSSSLAAARAGGANILITNQSSTASDLSLAAVVEAHPLTIVVLKPEGNTCEVITLKRREIPLGGKSMADLAKVVRKARHL